jgi:hypothetical protein
MSLSEHPRPASIRRYRLTVLLLAVLTVAVAGCGANETSQSAQVKAVVHGFLSEQVDGKPSEACNFLTGPARVQLVAFVAQESKARTPKTCEDALGVAHDRAPKKLLDALRTADITDVHVSGNHATVIVRGGAAFNPQEVSLKRAFGHMGRSWRIDGAPHLGS